MIIKWLATAGPFEKHHRPLAAMSQHRGRSWGDTGSNSTLCRAPASLTNHSGACWATLGLGFLQHNDRTGDPGTFMHSSDYSSSQEVLGIWEECDSHV